jgi:predicted DCC family thiol-disulfide oxidoreductase YuxK
MGKLTVLYNDKCPVCSFEIEHYRSLCSKRGIGLEFEKISVEGPVLMASHLTAEDAKKRLHLLTTDGRLLIGVEAFLALWAEMPGYRVLGRVVSMPGIYHLASLFYDRAIAPALFWLDSRRHK